MVPNKTILKFDRIPIVKLFEVENFMLKCMVKMKKASLCDVQSCSTFFFVIIDNKNKLHIILFVIDFGPKNLLAPRSIQG